MTRREDAISRYGREASALEGTARALDAAYSRAEGVASSIAGASGPGYASDAAAEVVACLAELVDAAADDLARVDGDRQSIVECVGMVRNQRHRELLMEALADAEEYGRVNLSRVAEEMGLSYRHVSRMWPEATEALDRALEMHHCT